MKRDLPTTDDISDDTTDDTAHDTSTAHVQSLPVAGHAGATHGAHLLLGVQSASAARQVLRALRASGLLAFQPMRQWLERGRGEPHSPPRHEAARAAIDIGFTFDGLKALGLADRWLEPCALKARAFSEGPARRAGRVGDAGASAPSRWEAAFQPRATQVVLTLHGHDAASLNQARQSLAALPGFGAAYTLRAELLAARLPGPAQADGSPSRATSFEHFGYRDGIARPRFTTQASAQESAAAPGAASALGELLLGHPNDLGVDLWDFRADAVRQGSGEIDETEEPHRTRAELTRFYRNGCFGVLRKMRQDVAAFEHFVHHAADALLALLHAPGHTPATHPLPDVEQARNYIKAQLCGRWPSGQVFRVEAGYIEPPGENLALIDYPRDPQAPQRACPAYGSHVRRMNPRGDPVVPARRRLLVRRGMPYVDGADRGLLGLFFCASIEDQFEHLLGEWGNKNPMGPDNAGTSKDPLIGNHEDPDAGFEIWLPDGRALHLGFDQPFVQTRGSLYAFYPSEYAFNRLCREP